MKRIIIDATDRLARLKRRLGCPPKRWRLRLKLGRWIALTPPMVRALGLRIGDTIKWQLTPRGMECCRERSQPDHTPQRRQPRRLLGQDESIVYAARPNCLRRQAGPTAVDPPPALRAGEPSVLSDPGAPASVVRGRSRRFKKQPRIVSLKHLAHNFENLFREVRLGRTVQICARGGQTSTRGMALVPISLEDRRALRQRPKKRSVSSKAGKRW